MDRKDFLKGCTLAGLTFIGAGPILTACTGSRSISAQLTSKGFEVPLSAFSKEVKGVMVPNRYIVLKHERLNYPIVVYNDGNSKFRALLLRCTHQAQELNVAGEALYCPAHGSEFNAKGEVTQGPASENLRALSTMVEGSNLYIQTT